LKTTELNAQPDATTKCLVIRYVTILHLRADLSLTRKAHGVASVRQVFDGWTYCTTK